MRHLGSLLLSVLVTALWYVILGLGYSQAIVKSGPFPDTTDKIVLAAAFLVAGALYGLLLLLRLSPVGLVVSGLALAVLGFWTLFSTPGPFDFLPRDIGSYRGALIFPTQYAPFAAIPLLLTVFSPRRWRRYADPQPVAGAYSPNPPVPVPGQMPGGGYPPLGGYPPPDEPVDPFAKPVSPAGGEPEGTRFLPSGAPSGSAYPAPSGSAYPAPSSGSPGYPAPSSGGSAYPPPSSGSAGRHLAPPPTGFAPLWPGAPGGTRDDPDATRPI